MISLGEWREAALTELGKDREIGGLINFVAGLATCPCCCESVDCMTDCTFAEDCAGSRELEMMMAARQVLKEALPRAPVAAEKGSREEVS